MNPRLSNGSATLFAALAMPGLFLCACGGDSGSTSGTPAPTVSIGISSASVPAGQPAMLTWSSKSNRGANLPCPLLLLIRGRPGSHHLSAQTARC